jgi:hypothetical protein
MKADEWMAVGAERFHGLLFDQENARARTKPTLNFCIAMIFACASGYGAVMGAFGGIGSATIAQLFISAVKVPLLLLATFGISLPCFFVLSTLLRLREDFADSIAALFRAQACLAIVLASLSPFTVLWYVSVADYTDAILFNAGMFAVATFAAQFHLRRSYRMLIARSPRHQLMLRIWLMTYSFVGIQMGWILRPFVGNPILSPAFFRAGAFTNAYVVIAHMIAEKL